MIAGDDIAGDDIAGDDVKRDDAGHAVRSAAAPAVPRTRGGSRGDAGAGWALAFVVLLCLTMYTVLGDTASTSLPVRTQGSVDLGRVVQATSGFAMGIGSSTYGATVVSSPVQALNERRLDAATVRIPVAVRDGVVTSGAAGAGDVPVDQVVARYHQWGYRVLAVIDAATPGAAVSAEDVRTIVTHLGYGDAMQYSTSNEPDNHGLGVADAISQAQLILRAGRQVAPGFRIWGPVWSSYDRAALRQFAAALGSGLAGLDFHAYAMGQTALPTEQALQRTSTLEQEVRRTRADLQALGLRAAVSVDELNLTWRFDDGTPGGDTRLLSAVDTVWLASACGHVMIAGGTCLPYANQNGPLGMLTESGQIPLGRQPSTPMPGYWGIAAWTGAGLFPHMSGAFLDVHVSVPGVEVYAVRNAAAGYNIVVIDKAQQPATTSFVLGVGGVGPGRYVPYTSDPARPYNAFVAGPSRRYRSTISLVVHAMTVTTLVLTPAAADR